MYTGSTTMTDDNILAEAFIDGSPMWKWTLRIDDLGLFRWYLDEHIATHLRAGSREQAERALRRFVTGSLRGELRITDVCGQIGAGVALGKPDGAVG
jgi:hypothetical protein